MSVITFPTATAQGQEYVAENGATYIWMGAYWSSHQANELGKSTLVYDGGDSAYEFNPLTDLELDGGTA